MGHFSHVHREQLTKTVHPELPVHVQLAKLNPISTTKASNLTAIVRTFKACTTLQICLCFSVY